jgi:hypothetical protein
MARRRAGGRDAGERWQRPSADFLRSLLALPELALVAESCPAGALCHERLVVEPTRGVDAGELAAIADGDARENYATFLAFRDAVERAGTSRRITSRSFAVADRAAAGLPRPHGRGDRRSARRRRTLTSSSGRAAQLLHRAQRVAVVDGRVLCADASAPTVRAKRRAQPILVRDLMRGGGAIGEMRSSAPATPMGSRPTRTAGCST